MYKKLLFACLAVAGLSSVSPRAPAATILVGQCVEYATCWYSGGSWSDSLTGSQLDSLGLGTDVPLVAAQTSAYVIRLGVTTMVFDTTGGTVTESLSEFNGIGEHPDPCNLCEIDTVGSFSIPTDALSAMISGTFGNSLSGSSAGVNVCLNSGAPCGLSSVPEPGTLALLAAGIGALALLVSRRRKARSLT